MNDPRNVDLMLKLLSEEPKPLLSPYFDARLRRAIAEPAPQPRHSRLVRYGAIVFMMFAAAVLAGLDYFRWLIPLMIFLCMPEDWGDAVLRKLRFRE